MYFLSAKLQSVILVIASKTWTVIKCGGGGAEKIRRRLNRSVDDFESTEIRLGTSAKFDGAGV